ncbi:MAG: hypothetical protein HWN65_06290 [Candidatus Helarchaeota archaeon]|nr:hypothetical protein [Candidatus Helarchaeota archaeon]
MDDLRNISQLALEILKLAEEMTKSKSLNVDALYREAKKGLNYMYSDQEINQTIYELILKKIIIPDKRIVKTQVLANGNREAIYKYIVNHPGAHLREIRDKLNLQPHVTSIHLKVLENFEYIYRKMYLKYRVYFPSDFIRENEDVLLALKNEKAEKIFLTIHQRIELSLIELKTTLAETISSKMVDYHLEPLISCGLITNYTQDGKPFLKINEETFEKAERYLKPIIEGVEVALPMAEKLGVKRAYDYVGGDVRFKVVVENKSKDPIRGISVLLDVKEQFTVKDPSQKVTVLEPEESRGVDFYLTPLACGKSKIHGTVSFLDPQGQEVSSDINPVLVQIKCPLVTPRIFKLLEVLKMKDRFQLSHAEIPYQGITQLNAFRIARDQVSSLDMSEIGGDGGDEGEDFSVLFSGIAKVTDNPLLVDLNVDPNKINIDVYMGDLRQATGFLAYIKNLINVALSYSQQISTSIEKIRSMIFNAFEFSSRLTELFEFCFDLESLDDVLLLLKELRIKSQSYFADLKLAEGLDKWFGKLEPLQGQEVYARTYLNLQYDIQKWLEAVITYAETNAQIYYESGVDQYTQDEIGAGIYKLKDDLKRKAIAYFKKILFSLMLIHSETGLTLYSHNFATQTTDADLISGFLSAIQGFGMEVSHQETKMKRLSYEHFEIELSDGSLTMAALITSGLPNQLTSAALREYILRFEARFRPQLETFSGNVSQFATAEELVQSVFLMKR